MGQPEVSLIQEIKFSSYTLNPLTLTLNQLKFFKNKILQYFLSFGRWSQKRRDRVDQILVRELHSEESAWTDYSADEANVKDQLTESLLDMMLLDTVNVFAKIYEKKQKKSDE